MQKDVSIILNGNARRTPKKIQDQFRALRHPRIREVYISQTQDEAKQIINDVITNKDKMTYWRGGDGTLLHLSNLLRTANPSTPPAIAYARGGTGNGIADYIQSTGTIKELESLLNLPDTISLPKIEIPLITTAYQGPNCNGTMDTFFASTGWDAQVVKDYDMFKKHTPSLCHGVAGYLISGLTISLPKMLFTPMQKPIAKSTAVIRHNRQDGSYQTNIEINPQNIPIASISVGTVPYYGYKFKAFPNFNAYLNKFSARFLEGPTSKTVKNLILYLPTIWKGTHTGPTFQDYLTSNLMLNYAQPIAMQIGGDYVGDVTEVTYSMSSAPLSIINWQNTIYNRPTTHSGSVEKVATGLPATFNKNIHPARYEGKLPTGT